MFDQPPQKDCVSETQVQSIAREGALTSYTTEDEEDISKQLYNMHSMKCPEHIKDIY